MSNLSQTFQAAIDHVRKYRLAAGISKSRLAITAGLGINSLARMDDPDWRPAMTTIEAIERVIPDDFEATP